MRVCVKFACGIKYTMDSAVVQRTQMRATHTFIALFSIRHCFAYALNTIGKSIKLTHEVQIY